MHMDFEVRNDVTIPEYLKLTEHKTAVLVGAAMKMGAIIANASNNDQNAIYDFGCYLGIAFQLQDDYLDAFVNPETFGKLVVGDIIENKKTYLFLKAQQFLNDDKRETLVKWYSSQSENATEKIKAVKLLFMTSGAESTTKNAAETYTNKAFVVLENLNISNDKKALLKKFGTRLMTRTM